MYITWKATIVWRLSCYGRTGVERQKCDKPSKTGQQQGEAFQHNLEAPKTGRVPLLDIKHLSFLSFKFLLCLFLACLLSFFLSPSYSVTLSLSLFSPSSFSHHSSPFRFIAHIVYFRVMKLGKGSPPPDILQKIHYMEGEAAGIHCPG
jgi:hypothetical protein